MNGPGAPSPFVPPSSTALPQGPLGFGQILDRIFQLMRANLKPFLAIASLPAGIMSVLYSVMIAGMFLILQPWHHPNAAVMPMKLFAFMAVWFVVYLLFILVWALYLPAAVHAALEANGGAKASCREAYAAAWRKAGRYIWLMILFCAIVAGPILVVAAVIGGVAVLVFAGRGQIGSSQLMIIPLIILLYIGAMVYGVLMSLWLSLAWPASAVENLTAWAAIRRSFSLTRGAKGKIFLLLLVIYALVYAGMLALELVLGFVGAVMALAGMALHLALNPWGYLGIGVAALFLLAGMFAMMAISWSGYSTVFAVVYHDQRLRKEGIAPAPVQAG